MFNSIQSTRQGGEGGYLKNLNLNVVSMSLSLELQTKSTMRLVCLCRLVSSDFGKRLLAEYFSSASYNGCPNTSYLSSGGVLIPNFS